MDSDDDEYLSPSLTGGSARRIALHTETRSKDERSKEEEEQTARGEDVTLNCRLESGEVHSITVCVPLECAMR